MESPFISIYEKLDRADESIRNLDTEIARFFEEGEYCPLPQHDTELMLKAISYHRNRKVPHRFSVLAGEIIHHLRSSLDHLVWQLSSEEERRNHPKRIEFPVFESRPVTKDEIASYERKIKGVKDSTARSLIEDLQPYKSPDPPNDLLLILHKLDIIDKHRELVLFVAVGHLDLPASIVDGYLRDKGGNTENLLKDLYPQIKQYGKVTPQIAISDFGQRPIQTVIPGLLNLAYAVADALLKFKGFE